MKGISGWSYAPYKPFLYNSGDIYICRIVPSAQSIHFEWLEKTEAASVYYKKTDAEEYIFAGKTTDLFFDLTELEPDCDYAFYVEENAKKSRVRFARTGEYVGTIVNYLHPDDDVYAFSGKYLCSPSLVRHPDGFLLASCDLYADRTPQNLTLIFRSDDDGKTWHYVSELMPCFWGKMFIHNNELYMISVSTEYGDLLIGKSQDGGKTFCTPTVIMRGSGKRGIPGFHKNPQNMMVYKGRIYFSAEWGTWENTVGDYLHAATVISCDAGADLLNAENWNVAEPVKYDYNNPLAAKGNRDTIKENIEGTLVVFPDGNLYNVMRYELSPGSDPQFGYAIAYRVNTENPDAPLEFSRLISFPANKSKFTIKFDEKSGFYYSIANYIGEVKRFNHRDYLVLLKSKDMENWEIAAELIDYRGIDPWMNGFQYVDFEFDGEDIIYLCRTAMNKPHNFHDSNCITFHRIENFRNL